MYHKHKPRTLALILVLSLTLLGTVSACALGGTTSAQLPRSAEEAQLAWSSQLREADDWTTNTSDPVLMGSDVYIAVGSELLRLSEGTQTGKAALAGPIDFTCRPLVLGGVIYIPLSQGRLQAVDTATLQSRWVTDALPEHEGMAHQSQTTLIADGERLYFGTACADWTSSYYGVYLCVNAADGRELWRHENPSAGYYWSGAAVSGDALLIAGDDGILTALNKTTGAAMDTLDVAAPVRSTIAVDAAFAYVAAKDGVVHQVALNSDGSFGAHRSLRFAADSTSSPAAADGKIYVGGATAQDGGVLAVINAADMTLAAEIAAGAPVQASPLVSTAYDKPYVYYTANGLPGALYVYDGRAAAALYTPGTADQNYCMASAYADSDGTLYYSNDSGKLFAIAKKAESALTWLDKLPDWLHFLRGWKPWAQHVVYYVFFGWIWDVIYK